MNVATFYNSRFFKLGFPWGAVAPRPSAYRGLRPGVALHLGGMRLPKSLHLEGCAPKTLHMGFDNLSSVSIH